MGRRGRLKPRTPEPAAPEETSGPTDPHRSDSGLATGPSGRPVQGFDVIQAFWRGDDVVYLQRDEHGIVRMRSTPAEHSAFIRPGDLEPEYVDALRRHPVIRGVHEEGEYLRLRFDRRDDVKDFCKAALEDGVPTFEGAINPVMRWMVDNHIGVAEPRIAYFDLETDSRVPFSRAVEGEARVLSWAACDAHGNSAADVLKADTDRREMMLLGDLMDWLDDYDLVAAWNGDRFDFPLLKNRLMLRGLLNGREWRRHLWLDQLALFQRMNMMAAESGDEKQSFALGRIATALLGEGKDDFDASKTWEAWVAGGEARRILLRYNIKDTALLPRIEEKTGFIRLLRTLGDVCGTFADSRGTSPQTQVESYLQRLARDRDQKIPTRLISRKTTEQYKGAYVMEPKRGGILTDVHVADFASLYPSIIRTWNMSPETVTTDPGRCNFDGTPLSDDIAYSPLTEVYFRTDVEGILSAAVKELMALRTEWKKKKAAAPPGTDAWKDADRRSTAYKIAANSFYGVIGAPTSRFFRRPVAESVSQCGAWLIMETIREAEQQGMEVVYGDTDSLFVVGASRTEFEEFVKFCNQTLYPRKLEEMGCAENHIKLAYEKQFRRIVMTRAKRYVGSYVHYDGTEATVDSKPEIKGLEFKRGDTARIARQMQEEICYLLVGYKCDASDDPADYEEILQKWRRHILVDELPMEDVMISKRLSKSLDAYSRKRKQNGDWARQPPQVEMARILADRGHDIGEGAKIEFYYADGFSEVPDIRPAEDWDGRFDRHHFWEKMVAPATLRVLEIAFPGHDWKPWEKTRPSKRRLKARPEGKRGRRRI